MWEPGRYLYAVRVSLKSFFKISFSAESELILVDKFRTELILSDRIGKCADFG